MLKFLRWFATACAVLLAALVLLAIVARFADGPIGLFAGGPLRSGELISDPDLDWSFVEPVQEIELQLLEPPRSRTVWIVFHEGHPYVPCGFLKVPLWKQWPHQAVRDGRAVVRIDGKRYERQAVRVTDAELYAALAARVAEKYGGGGSGTPDPDSVWFFRLDPRPAT